MCSAFLIRTSKCIPVSVSCLKMFFLFFTQFSVCVAQPKTWVTAAAATYLLPPSGVRASLRPGEEEAAGVISVNPPDGPHRHTHRRCGKTRHRPAYFVWQYNDGIVRTKVGGNKRRLQWQQQQVEWPLFFFFFFLHSLPCNSTTRLERARKLLMARFRALMSFYCRTRERLRFWSPSMLEEVCF